MLAGDLLGYSSKRFVDLAIMLKTLVENSDLDHLATIRPHQNRALVQ